MFHTIEGAISDLKKGKPIIVVDDENRENEGDFVALSEMATPEIINFMITHGKGLVCTTMKENLANKLGLTMMATQNTDPFATAFTVSIDHKDSTTGISATERSNTIQALTEPEVKKTDFIQPGHVFPLISKDGGVFKRQGHTEASVDLAELCGSFPSAVICEVIKEDGEMARIPDLIIVAKKFDLKIVSIEDLIAYKKIHESLIKREIETSLPTEFGTFRIIGYTNKIDEKEHLALLKGNIDHTQSTLVRIHSECLTGDIFGSHRCDCGPQLHEALEKIVAEENGVLIYMRQEGRGIGLINKLRAYKYQDEGMDTVEANTELGFAADLREYDISAQILLDLGITKVKLLTNNPQKMNGIEAHGISIEKRIPIQTQLRSENKKYMLTKSAKLGHLLSL